MSANQTICRNVIKTAIESVDNAVTCHRQAKYPGDAPMVCCESRIESRWIPTHRVLVFMPTRRCAASFDVMLAPDGGARTVGAFERGEGPSLHRQPGGWVIPPESDLPDADEAVIFRIRPTSPAVADWEALAM